MLTLLIVCVGFGGAASIRHDAPDIDSAVVGDTVCCIAVDASDIEAAKELSRLNIGYGSVGRLVVEHSQEVWEELETRGYEPQLTCLELVEKAVLDSAVQFLYLGKKSRTSAGKPVLARWKSRDTLSGKWHYGVTYFGDWPDTIAIDSNASGTVVSEHGEFVAISRGWRKPGPGSSSSYAVKQHEIFDRLGQSRGIVETAVHGPEYSDFLIVSKAGNYAKIGHTRVRVSFFSCKHESLVTVNASEESAELGGLFPAFSPDGECLVIQVLGAGGDEEVILLSADGTILWRFRPNEKYNTGGGPWLADGGSYVVASFAEMASPRGPTRQITYLFDRDGETVRVIDGMWTTGSWFSPSLDYVAVDGHTDRDRFMLLKLPDASTVFERASHHSTRDCDIAEKPGLIGMLRDRIYLADLKGREIWCLRGNDARFLRRLSLSDDGKELALAGDNKYYLFRRIE